MSDMIQRPLGSTTRTLSVMGFGCASYWAHPRYAESLARSVFEHALSLGVNFFDTGASYGGGLAERRLGRFLRAMALDPDAVLVGTKIGTQVDASGRLVKDFSPQSVHRQLSESLERLRLDRIGLLQLHGPGPSHLTDELLSALSREREAGRVALLGVNGDEATISSAVDSGVFDVVMPFVSVVRPSGRHSVEQARSAGLGVIAAEPLGRMLFAPPLLEWIRRRSGRWYLARALAREPRLLLRMRALRAALRAPGWTPAQLAFRWVIEQRGVSAAVVGSTNPRHLSELARVADEPLPGRVSEALNELLG